MRNRHAMTSAGEGRGDTRALVLVLVVALAAVAVVAAGARAAEAPAAGIFSARLDGSDARSLSGPDTGGAARGPGGRVFYVSAEVSGPPTFWVMNEDGSGQRRLDAAPGDGYFGPAWSPDGRTVAITRWDDSPCAPTSRNCADSLLVLADAESGEERLVLRPRVGRGTGDLSWAPDGSRLVFASELDMDLAASTVETIRPDGTGRRVLVRLPAGDYPGIDAVAWSPRGDRIAYDRGGWLYLVRPQGGASTRLVRGRRPVWSPNGRRLAFQSWRDDSIGVVDIATRRTSVIGRADEASHPTWSPDGARIAFEARTRGVSRIAVVRSLDARRLHTWRPRGDVQSLFFSRDGTRLLYSLGRS